MINDLIGKKFNKLKPIKYMGKDKWGNRWLCLCDCGNQKEISENNIKTGNVKSCGCLKNKIKHGHAIDRKQSKTYTAWKHMKHRCYNKK